MPVPTMKTQPFELPVLLSNLIKSGVWPTDNPNKQEFSPLLKKDAARKMSPEDDRIILMPPPFHTIGDEVRGGNSFWRKGVTNPNEIEYDKALIIADFGMGSDSPIILYYDSMESPTVMYLRWTGNADDIRQQWIETHATFDEFAKAVGLDTMNAQQTDEPEG